MSFSRMVLCSKCSMVFATSVPLFPNPSLAPEEVTDPTLRVIG